MKRKQEIPGNFNPQAETEEIDRREQSLDDALKESFPASDPPAALAPHCSRK
jgi:hypothetical protein